MAEDQRLRELMREYQAGRFEAFDEIYAAIAPSLRRYLSAQARDAAKADDLVQETFLQMHRARHTYDPSLPLMPWATAIARHVWLMDRRLRSRRPWAPDDVTEMELPVQAEAAALADRVAVRRALGQVVPARRDAVIQHHLLGLSFREIADRAGIAETAAKLRSSRGMAQLRALLRPPKAQSTPGPQMTHNMPLKAQSTPGPQMAQNMPPKAQNTPGPQMTQKVRGPSGPEDEG